MELSSTPTSAIRRSAGSGSRSGSPILGLVRVHGDYTGFYNIQLACSRDLVNWQRLGDRQPFLETSPLDAGAYDLQTMIGPSAPVVRGDELWFYYTGIKQYAFIASGNDPSYDDYIADRGAVCLAILRRDGFMSLDASDQEGRLTTKPFELNGRRLFINASVGKSGHVIVDVLNKSGNAVATSEPIVGDRPQVALRWERGTIANMEGTSLRLRFRVFNARLYSYWIDN